MSWQSLLKLAKSDYAKLVPILALAFYMAFIPQQGYSYPVHLDEWIHLAYSNQILQEGTALGLCDPFTGGNPSAGQIFEVGFDVFLAVFHHISGIPWLVVFKYLPAIIFVLTVLSVYILAQRQGFGWQAAVCACLIPTTTGLLGPGFLVPVAMGLLFVPLSFFVAFNLKGTSSYLLLFVFMSFLLTIHTPSATFLVIVLIPYMVLNLKDNFKHSLGLMLALGIPFIAAFPWIFGDLPMAKIVLTPQPLNEFVDIPSIVETFGFLPIVLSIVGVFALGLRGDKKSYGLVLGLLIIMVILSIFYTADSSIPILYERGLMMMMLMLSIVAGAGLAWLKSLRIPMGKWPGLSLVTKHGGEVACLVFVAITLVIAIPARQAIPYYHMIDKEDYKTFVWIKENVGDEYGKAILDPWKATAFTAITGKQVFSRIGAYPKPSDNEAYTFLSDGASDTIFLEENGISIIYTRFHVDNRELTKVRDHVYLLKIGD